MLMQTLCKKGMKMKKAVNTLNLYLPFLTFHDGTCCAANSTSKCKITKCFCKSTPLVLRNSIFFLVSH